MKKILLLATVVFFTSCSTTSFYQIYETNLNQSSNSFEDSNCKIIYDFWTPGGSAGFTVVNKTTKPIKLKLDESFFVLNDRAFDYFKSRTFTEGTDQHTVVSTVNNYYYLTMRQTKIASTSKSEVSYLENPVITIPANTKKTVGEYVVTNNLFESCNLKKYPTKKQVRSESFNETNSPYIFYNVIVYEHEGQKHQIKNEFFVSAITNLPEAEVFEQKRIDDCGKAKMVRVSKVAAPNKFYLQYFSKR